MYALFVRNSKPTQATGFANANKFHAAGTYRIGGVPYFIEALLQRGDAYCQSVDVNRDVVEVSADPFGWRNFIGDDYHIRMDLRIPCYRKD